MYRLHWYRRAFTRYGASNKCGVGKHAIIAQNVSISLGRWRWQLLHYFKQVVILSATCFHVELEQFSACLGLRYASRRICQRQLGFLVLHSFISICHSYKFRSSVISVYAVSIKSPNLSDSEIGMIWLIHFRSFALNPQCTISHTLWYTEWLDVGLCSE